MLKREEVQVKNAIFHVTEGYLPPLQKKKWRIFDAQLDDNKLAFFAGERTVFEYWEAVAHCSGPIIE